MVEFVAAREISFWIRVFTVSAKLPTVSGRYNGDLIGMRVRRQVRQRFLNREAVAEVLAFYLLQHIRTLAIGAEDQEGTSVSRTIDLRGKEKRSRT